MYCCTFVTVNKGAAPDSLYCFSLLSFRERRDFIAQESEGDSRDQDYTLQAAAKRGTHEIVMFVKA